MKEETVSPFEQHWSQRRHSDLEVDDTGWSLLPQKIRDALVQISFSNETIFEKCCHDDVRDQVWWINESLLRVYSGLAELMLEVNRDDR